MHTNNNMDQFVIALAGNKCDMNRDDWQIKENDVQFLKEQVKLSDEMIAKNTSAKTGEGVHELFHSLAQ